MNKIAMEKAGIYMMEYCLRELNNCHLLHHEFANKNIVIEKVCAIFRMHFFIFYNNQN